jgi:hypothetical protein
MYIYTQVPLQKNQLSHLFNIDKEVGCWSPVYNLHLRDIRLVVSCSTPLAPLPFISISLPHAVKEVSGKECQPNHLYDTYTCIQSHLHTSKINVRNLQKLKLYIYLFENCS